MVLQRLSAARPSSILPHKTASAKLQLTEKTQRFTRSHWQNNDAAVVMEQHITVTATAAQMTCTIDTVYIKAVLLSCTLGVEAACAGMLVIGIEVIVVAPLALLQCTKLSG